MASNINEIPKRLTPKLQIVRLLLAKSGNQCAYHNCTEVIFNDANELVGECCHIEAALPDGERFNPNQTNEERRTFDNLLFFCQKHHITTNDVNVYTVDRLKEIKSAHHKKFSEKEIMINPRHIDSVIDRFNEVAFNILETLYSVKRIESKQDIILEKFNGNNENDLITSINEFYGQPATPNFIGRKEETGKIEDNFSKFNTLIVQGISGIGKSSLIAHFLGEIQTHQIFWVNCDLTESKELFLLSLSKFLIQNFKDNSLEKCLSENNEKLIENNLIHFLKKYSICVVFDALNKSEHNLFSYVQVFNEKLTNSKIIVTTTQDFNILHWSNPVYKLPVKGVSLVTFRALSELYNIEDLSLGDLNILYDLTGGHPYLLKLVASISIYQPISNFILTLKNRSVNEIEDYIKYKIISKLNEDEKRFILYITLLEIPFRYDLGNYISNINFTLVIKSLQQSFLIEKLYDDFYLIPEFIGQHLKKQNENLVEQKHIEVLIDYLRNLDGQLTVIEKGALINLLLKAGFENSAKKECSKFLSSLMGDGHFNLVIKYSTEFLKKDALNKWEIILYVLGRVYRMKNEYEKSLEMYNKGILLGPENSLSSKFLYEKSSILFYLSNEENNSGYKDEAIAIYEKLSKSDNSSLSVQSELALSRILVTDNKQDKAILKIKKLIDTVDFNNLEFYVVAQIWHCLGDAYSRNNDFKKAFESFDESINHYKKALDINGLNALEGLYHLYISYGTTYSNGKDYTSASEMFAINVSLAEQFGLEKKLEQALLDLGYHLVLSEQYDKAIDILNVYYNLATEKETIPVLELPFIFGCMLFANWYSGKFTEAVELIGLYCNASLLSKRRPLITVIEGNDKVDEFDLIEYFKKGMKTLIIPSNKSIHDLQIWIKEVCSKRPELAEALSDFYKLEKK